MHYKTRANVYMVLGVGGVGGSCFGVRYCSVIQKSVKQNVQYFLKLMPEDDS